MAIHAGRLRGAHFSASEQTVTRHPVEKGYLVWAGIGAFLAVSSWLTIREMMTYDEIQPEPYEINNIDTYDPTKPVVSESEVGKSIAIDLNLDTMRRSLRTGDVAKCQEAVARIAIASPGMAETLECSLPAQG